MSFQYSLFDEVGLPSPGQNAVQINGAATSFQFTCTMPAASGRCTMAGGGPVPSSFKGSGWVSVASLSGVSVRLRQAAPAQP